MLTTAPQPTARRLVAFTENPILAEGFRRAFESTGQFELFVAYEPAEFMDLLVGKRPELAMLDDTAVPGLEFLHRAGAACHSCHLVLWAKDMTIETVSHAFECGMHGVVSGKSSPDALLAALVRVARGELCFPNLFCTPGELAGTRLAPRERHLVSLIAQGLKNKEIASAMGLTEGTVKVYLSRLYDRLGLSDRFELALFGLQAFFGTLGKSPAAAPGIPVYPASPAAARPSRIPAQRLEKTERRPPQ